jgi:Fis family transcriptional regulator
MNDNPPPSLEQSIREHLQRYFLDLQGVEPSGLHDLMIGVMEKPLLEVVLQKAAGNQSLAAQWLGINRNTLRRKLQQHQIIT